jgi:hypothetical protein
MADFKVYNPLTNIIQKITNIEGGKKDNLISDDQYGLFLPLTGGQMSGAIIQPLTPENLFDVVNKDYVDLKIKEMNINDATNLKKGIITLCGDLSGKADQPVIARGAVTNEKFAPCSQSKCLKGSSEASYQVEDLRLGTGFKLDKNTINLDMATIDDQLPLATPITKGILQLSGDLSGTSDSPKVSAKAITNDKLANLSGPAMIKGSGSNNVDPIDIILGDGLVMVDDKLNIDLKQVVTLPIPVSQGGTGYTSFKNNGYLKGEGDIISVVENIPVSNIVGAVTGVNGVLPNKDGNVTVVLGNVTTGMLSELPKQPQNNGSIFVVSGDVEPLNNGKSFVSDGSKWNEMFFNLNTTDSRYLLKSGDTLEGSLSVPKGITISISDLPKQDTDTSNKRYVDNQIKALNLSDATPTTKGILRLSGDLSGTSDSPTVKNSAITNVKLANMTNVSQIKGSLGSSKAVVDIGVGTGLKMDNSKLMVDSTSLATMFLPLNGGSMNGAISQPFPPVNPDDLSNKTYVDNQVNLMATQDATSSIKGKLRLSGDLSGTSNNPKVANFSITNAKLANMSNTSQLKGSSSTSSTTIDINIGNSLCMDNNTLNSPVSFFTGNNPNTLAPEDRPGKSNVVYVGSDGSLWIWSGSVLALAPKAQSSGSISFAAPGKQYFRGPGALNVLKSNTVYSIQPSSVLSSPITLTDFNIFVPNGSKIKVNYTLNFQNSEQIAPSFGWSGIHQTLDFFQASIIGFFGASSSFSTIYQVNSTLNQTGGADLYTLATINASNSPLSSTPNLKGINGEAIPVHIVAYYENNSGSLTTLAILFNRDVKTSTDQGTIQIVGGVVDYTFY